MPGAILAAAAEEYDAVYRALPEKNMANGVLPNDGLSSLQRAQVRYERLIYWWPGCTCVCRSTDCRWLRGQDNCNSLESMKSCCTGFRYAPRRSQSLWDLC